MNSDIDRAAELLFPDSGRRALDLKFFFQPGASASALARQVEVCFSILNDDAYTIVSIDSSLTV